jgi:hypothetical protein
VGRWRHDDTLLQGSVGLLRCCRNSHGTERRKVVAPMGPNERTNPLKSSTVLMGRLLLETMISR